MVLGHLKDHGRRIHRDGQLGSLAFVGTKSDDLMQSQILKQFATTLRVEPEVVELERRKAALIMQVSIQVDPFVSH